MTGKEDVNKAVEAEARAEPAAEAAQAPRQDEGKKAKKSSKKTEDAAKLSGLEEQLAQAEQANAEMKDQLLRTKAEYDNFRRRSKAEQEASFGSGVGHAAVALLPVIDTLEAAANAETTDEEYKKGVLLTLEKCADVFKKLGIEEIAALGCEFDPNLHNAVMQESGGEGCACNTVTRVIQKGYIMNGKVVRHAMVAVAP